LKSRLKYKTLAIIQARMNSARLPGKVLMPVNDRPLLSYMVERVRTASYVDNLLIATSIEESDDPIEQYCLNNHIPVFRGNLDDVLDRFYQASKTYESEIIVRLTGDCPLIDPTIIDTMISKFKNSDFDYLANTAPPKGITYPEGMDVEIFTKESLKKAWMEAKKPSEREHVTFYFWKNTHLFSISRHDLNEDYSNFRLTVDYPEDFKLVKNILDYFYTSHTQFNMGDIISYLDDNPKIADLNKNIDSFTGWTASLVNDKLQGFDK
jgi:spore coat polysaccharide biosynthesis protein SpsF